MKYANGIRELIGNTPIIKLNNFEVKSRINIFGKLEGQNPGGSCKDRIGLYMVEKAERQGALKKGSTIIEATAGNTGIGIALASLNKGYRVIFVIPEKFSTEKQTLLKALGAELIITPKEKGMMGACDKAEELLKTIPDSISLKQFENDANPLAHYETTGKEIYEQLDGEIDYIVAGAGSGGTITGVLKYLKERNSKIKGVLGDPYGSTIGGGIEGCYKIEGIGNNFIPKTMDLSYIDIVKKVKDEEAFYYVKELARREGIVVGSSSGAAMAAAIALSKDIDSGNIVVIFPDRGDRYFSKNIFD
ncbi:PLP-dependent cysteine synthase family protein [Clostridium intestinale]|uniref:Cysteine synthase n=1 Tax=Clostridium intestinale URNW TaxID=1294142 RepID=U2Q0V7_9CLOT|nr:cysteine synthase family protein [Clostridium intestinale]ERK29664.1 cysteine synthase [Clostridium intestinale URNW]